MTMLADPDGVVIGVDTHKFTHTAAAVTATGAVLECVTVAADPAGYAQLVGFAARHGCASWAIEGTGSFGAGLSRVAAAAGYQVFEVDRPQRPARRGGAKSDDIDAVRAARQLLAGVGVSTPRRRGEREAIRVLLSTRAQAVEFRTATIASLHALIISAPQAIRDRLSPLASSELLRACAALRRSARHDCEHAATITALRAAARRALNFETEARQLGQQLTALVKQVAPQLLAETGVGPIVAAQLVVSWSHPGRVHSEAGFARLAGVAPIPASSGTVTRHRLCRSGDRQLNRALHTIVLIRIRQDPTTQAYVARRQAEGKTIREIRRCLKRYLARHLYRQLEHTPPPLDKT
jgi:transposase